MLKYSYSMKIKPLILIFLSFFSNVLFAQTDSVAIRQIKNNYAKIKTIKKWTRIDTIDIHRSTEGGMMYVYYIGDSIKLIKEHDYGEMAQGMIEFYLLRGKLSFAYNREIDYKRPIYWDSAAMKEEKDSEVFDFKKSRIVDTRYYFNVRMLRWIDRDGKIHDLHDDNFAREEADIMKWYTDVWADIVKGKDK
jgi:hypothetical protein